MFFQSARSILKNETPFKYSNGDEMTTQIFVDDMKRIKRIGREIGAQFRNGFPQPEAYVFLFFDELDFVVNEPSNAHSGAVTYLWWHMCDGLMDNNTFQAAGAGRMPELSEICRDGHLMQNYRYGFNAGSPSRGIQHVPLNPLGPDHISNMVVKENRERGTRSRVPKKLIPECAESVYAVTLGVPRYVSWALQAIYDMFAEQSCTPYKEFLLKSEFRNNVVGYSGPINELIRRQPLPFLTLATASVLGIRFAPDNRIDMEGRTVAPGSRGGRPMLDWCRAFNFYVDFDKHSGSIRVHFPPVLQGTLTKTPDSGIEFANQHISEIQDPSWSALMRAKAHLVKACFEASGTFQFPSTELSNFGEVARACFTATLPDQELNPADSSIPQRGNAFERIVFSLYHLRLLELTAPGMTYNLSYSFPCPENMDVKYNPLEVKIATIPKVTRQTTSVETSAADPLRLFKLEEMMKHVPFLTSDNKWVTMPREDWPMIYKRLQPNCLYATAPGSSSADMYALFPPQKWGLNKKFALKFSDMVDEFEKAFPVELRESLERDDMKVMFSSVCGKSTKLPNQLKDLGAATMSRGWYLNVANLSNLSEEKAKKIDGVETLKNLEYVKNVTFIVVSQEEMTREFAQFMNEKRYGPLLSYYQAFRKYWCAS
eukprot:gb/GECG01009473.1/.p1 GENE.gb/GECG01009473.1/~~gb/GECG01009473.1/.p1  ORF type:complete len:656 (+),score=61.09 gb/GECG01009473.1/:1-1968(+)